MTTANDAPMPCSEVEVYLPLRATQGLPERERTAIREHLLGCSECRDFSDWLEQTALERPEPPFDLRTRVLARIDPAKSRRGPVWRRAEWALPAAALVVLSLGAGAIWQQMGGPELSWLSALDEPTIDWDGEDWLVAGEPHLDAVPYDVLIALLEDMGE